MNLAIIDGFLGAGKTLAMTLLSLYFQELSGCALYSNYAVKGSKEFSHYHDFMSIADESSSILMLDEAHTDLDSRNYNTNAVKYFTHLIFYLRKLRCTIMLATPSIDNIDSRVRGIANLYIHVNKNRTHFIYEFWDIQSGRYLKTYKIRQEDAFICSALAYDTFNMVLPVTFPDDRKEFNSFVIQLKEKSNQFYLQQVEGEGQRLPAAGTEPVTLDVQTIYQNNDYIAVI
jgi:hypothetical protein